MLLYRVSGQEGQHEFWSLFQSAFMSASGENSLWELLRGAEMAGALRGDAEVCAWNHHGWLLGAGSGPHRKPLAQPRRPCSCPMSPEHEGRISVPGETATYDASEQLLNLQPTGKYVLRDFERFGGALWVFCGNVHNRYSYKTDHEMPISKNKDELVDFLFFQLSFVDLCN